MRKLFILFYVIFLSACATMPRSGTDVVSSPGDFMTADDFCRRYGLKYNFDTLGDEVNIFSKDKQLKLILNTKAAYFNARFFNLTRAPYYSSGVVFLPRELERIIVSKEDFPRPAFNITRVILDPGHGGKDPGAISRRGLKEKDVNLKICKLIEQELNKRGFKVAMTRSSDIYLTLQERVDAAKKCNADIFISVHANAGHSRSVSGTEIYYLSPLRLESRQRAGYLARSRDIGSGNISVEAQEIVWDLTLTRNYSLSVEFAGVLCESFHNLGFKVLPAKRAPFYVLRLAYVPSVLVETGYLTNRREERALRSGYYQKQIAEAIALGVISLNKRYIYLAKNYEQ